MSGSVRVEWTALPVPLSGAAAISAEVPRAQSGSDARIEALDGLRGVLAMMVVIAHYFGEVPHGISAALFGWIAVKVFFVLSGFLMARVILDHVRTPGFFPTFYVRRLCRTVPVYLVALFLVFGSAILFHASGWMEPERILPFWSYLTFTQSFVMVAHGNYGSEWLTPTWTLTVEEQFYLIAPIICLLVPGRHLLKTLAGLTFASVAFRWAAYGFDAAPHMAANILLPGAAHAMFIGMIAFLLLQDRRLDWARLDLWVRAAPVALLVLVFVLRAVQGEASTWFQMFGVPLVSVAAACYLVAIVRDAPEAASLRGPMLGFLGRLSYGIYLLHMPVLGLLHGLVLDGKPDIGTAAQLSVTIAAVPAAVLVAWVVNRLIEAPAIAYGRKWKFARPQAS